LPGYPPGRAGDQYSCTLYAVTEADARLMVEAVFEVLDAPGRAAFEEMKTRLFQARDRYRETLEKLAELQREKQRAIEACEEAQKASGYETPDVAAKDLERLDVSLRALEVTIVGINAKIAAIEKLKIGQGKPIDESTRLMLDRLHVEQDVELAGALAQKGVLESQRQRAQTHLDTSRRLDELSTKAGRANKYAAGYRMNAENLVKRLKDPRSSVGRPDVIGNVVIHPIEYEGE
jgi:hypothetical protein